MMSPKNLPSQNQILLAEKSIKDAEKTVEEVLGKGPQLAVVGNKIDLVDKQVVDKEKGEEYANKIGAMFYETSAKEDSKGFQNFILQLTEEFINKKGYIKKSGEKLSKKEKKSKGCSC